MRRSTWITATMSLLAASLLCGRPVLAVGPPAASDEAKVLNCTVDELLPPEPAAADEGGYRFEFQSIRGVTADDRVCTLYRVRNTAGHAPTPLRWMQGEELLMEKTRLARCRADADVCPWISVAKYFQGHVDTNLSVIRYGLNADAYDRQAETFLGSIVLDDAQANQSVGTEVEGMFATAAGEVVPVHLIVKSRIEPGADGRQTAVLEVTDLGGRGDLANGTLSVTWDALTASGQAAAALRSAAAEDLMGIALGSRQPDGASPASGPSDPSTTVERSDATLEVAFPVEAYELRREFLLSIRYRDAPEPLITVEMPALLPSPGQP